MKSQLIHSTRGKCKKSWSHSLFTSLRLPFVNFLSFCIDSLQFQILFYFIGLHCMEMALTHAVQCMDSEQEALLKIKEGFIKSSDPFSSWTAEKDCCKWRGVGCDNTNGHVTVLYLQSRVKTNSTYCKVR